MVMGTRAHQTALYVVFESELQMLADTPDAYTAQKETEFLKAVPATWDETRVVNGIPPKYITVARRGGPSGSSAVSPMRRGSWKYHSVPRRRCLRSPDLR